MSRQLHFVRNFGINVIISRSAVYLAVDINDGIDSFSDELKNFHTGVCKRFFTEINGCCFRKTVRGFLTVGGEQISKIFQDITL